MPTPTGDGTLHSPSKQPLFSFPSFLSFSSSPETPSSQDGPVSSQQGLPSDNRAADPAAPGSFLPYLPNVADAITSAVSDQLGFFAVGNDSRSRGSIQYQLIGDTASVKSDMLRPDDLSWYRGHSKSRSEGSGIIQVSSRFLPTRTVSDELEALNQIPQFQPLIPTTVSSQSFNWGGLFAPSQRRLPGTAAGLDPRSSTALLEKCRRHIQRCADNVARDQKILIDSISNMDEYCAKLANTVAHRSHQAKVQGEKLSSITIIRDVAHKTRLALSSVLISLDKLELLLPPEARLSQLKSKYPALAKAMTQNNSSIPAVRSL